MTSHSKNPFVTVNSTTHPESQEEDEGNDQDPAVENSEDDNAQYHNHSGPLRESGSAAASEYRQICDLSKF